MQLEACNILLCICRKYEYHIENCDVAWEINKQKLF